MPEDSSVPRSNVVTLNALKERDESVIVKELCERLKLETAVNPTLFDQYVLSDVGPSLHTEDADTIDVPPRSVEF